MEKCTVEKGWLQLVGKNSSTCLIKIISQCPKVKVNYLCNSYKCIIFIFVKCKLIRLDFLLLCARPYPFIPQNCPIYILFPSFFSFSLSLFISLALDKQQFSEIMTHALKEKGEGGSKRNVYT